jgi:hypothetical protein
VKQPSPSRSRSDHCVGKILARVEECPADVFRPDVNALCLLQGSVLRPIAPALTKAGCVPFHTARRTGMRSPIDRRPSRGRPACTIARLTRIISCRQSSARLALFAGISHRSDRIRSKNWNSTAIADIHAGVRLVYVETTPILPPVSPVHSAQLWRAGPITSPPLFGTSGRTSTSPSGRHAPRARA